MILGSGKAALASGNLVARIVFRDRQCGWHASGVVQFLFSNL